MSVTRISAKISSCSIANITFQNWTKVQRINNENHYVTITFIDDDRRMEIFTLGPFTHNELGETISFINNFIERDFNCQNHQ